ncbi:MAG TPA: hypothetical protein VF412_08815, partial [Bdellovibrio sp.]|uniref:hypothetical protein n=1 Tax=Bdellovibrio sp. TaxID=28201 RepID=UPI002EE5D949
MNTKLIFLQIGFFFAGVIASAKSFDSSISGFNLKTCSIDHTQCVEVHSASTQGSQLKMLHTLSKPKVTITTAQKNETILADSGYIDLEENQLVIYKKLGREQLQ